MNVLRSLLFNVAFFGSLAIALILMLVSLVFDRRVIQVMVRWWVQVAMGAARLILGLSHEVRGLENLPKGAAIVAAKHQSAWDTTIFYLMVDDPTYVMKKELMSIPFWGWFAHKAKAIGVDRKGGASALKKMVRDSRAALKNNQTVVIFPEGTRTAVGASGAYHPGVAAMYRDGAAPVVPVALNSGLFWPRRSFVKLGGVITIQFLPAIPAGLDRKAFMARLRDDVETATAALVTEARERFPHLPQEDAET